MNTRKMMCTICDAQDSKYKCPNCKIPYCSLNCWKEHKKTDCKPTSETLTSSNKEHVGEGYKNYSYTTEDTVSLERLKLLEESIQLKQILQNPDLRNMLKAIDSSSDPAHAMQMAMQEPTFVEFANECLKVVEPVEGAPP